MKDSFATLGQDAEVIELNSEGAALEYFRENKVRAVLFGLSKAEPNRVDLVEQLRSINRSVALLVVTDIEDWNTWQRLIQTGAHCLSDHKHLTARQLALQTMQTVHQFEMQEGLRAEEIRNRSIISMAPEAIVEIDAFGRILSTNQKLEEVFGWSVDELIGKPITECLFPLRLRSRFDDLIARYRLQLPETTELITGPLEFIALTNQGKELPVELSTATISVAEQFSIALFFHDISQRLTIEEKERKLMLMKQRAIFSATLTHDLKSPLSGSIRLIEALLGNKVQELSPALREIMIQLQNCNLVQLELIQDLLELYRLEDNKVSGQASAVNLSEIVTACRQDLKAQAESKEIEIITNAQDNKVPLVFGDSGKLRRVIYNLLDNALKFGSSKSIVKVNFSRVDNMVAMVIEDRGPGIPPNEIPNLFAGFQQGVAGRSMQFGSGLGLHLCKHIVEAHGGTIECHSVVDQGTRFIVYLPSAEDIYEAPRDDTN